MATVVESPPTPAAVQAPVVQPAQSAPPPVRAYRLDVFCLKVWIAGAAVLLLLHILDAVLRLMGSS